MHSQYDYTHYDYWDDWDLAGARGDGSYASYNWMGLKRILVPLLPKLQGPQPVYH